MARVKKKIVAKDYNSLIKISKDKIEKLTQDLKEEKTNLKLLEKDAASYEKHLFLGVPDLPSLLLNLALTPQLYPLKF